MLVAGVFSLKFHQGFLFQQLNWPLEVRLTGTELQERLVGPDMKRSSLLIELIAFMDAYGDR